MTGDTDQSGDPVADRPPIATGGLRILHIIASVDPASGGPIEGILRQEEATRNIGGAASRRIVSLDPPDAAYLSGFPLRVSALGRAGRRRRGPVRRLLDRYRYAPAMLPWLHQNAARFDLILVHGLWNYSAWAASRALPGSDTPYFVFSHGMLDPWFRRRYPLKHYAKGVSWRLVERRLLLGARSVLFTCDEERRLAQTSFGGGYRETVVGYGAAPPPAPAPNEAGLVARAVPALDGRPFLLFLGRIHEKKGVDILIEGFARAVSGREDVQLVIAGPDPHRWRPQLEQLAAQRGVATRVHWPGPLYGADKWAALRQAEAFVLPSHQENFGIAVAEALGCGTPVLISRQVNIWREIAAAGGGIVDEDDVEGVERQLRRWFGASAADRAAMAGAARQLFHTSFCVTQTAPALLRTLVELTRHDLPA